MLTTAKVEGFKELDRALGELPKATARNVLKRTLKKAAQPVLDDWVANEPRRTGHLALSTVIGTRLTRRQASEARKDGKYFAEVHVGTADPAGQFQEFGTFKEPAQPSGRPAWEKNKERALEIIGKELGGEIEKSAAKLARKAARLAAAG